MKNKIMTRITVQFLAVFSAFLLFTSVLNAQELSLPESAPNVQEIPAELAQELGEAQQHEELKQEPDNYVKVRLIPSKSTIGPGEEIWIATEQSIYEGWHTYWLNPGDSGSPTRLDWTLPEGFTIDEIRWPTPEKIPYGPLMNFGYEDSAILLQKLKAPDDIPEGTLVLNVAFETLVCDDICIPEFGDYTLTLNNSGDLEADNSAFIEQALEKIPQPVDWAAEYIEQNSGFFLKFSEGAENLSSQSNGGQIDFLVEEWGIVDNPSPVHMSVDGDVIIFAHKRGARPLSEVEALDGVITIKASDEAPVQGLSFSARPSENGFVIPKELSDKITPEDVSEEQAGVKTSGSNRDGGFDIESVTLIQSLIAALIGGLILNLMPCVFPVLSLKALSLCKIAEKSKKAAQMHGLSYTAGIILSFVAIAGILIALKAGGEQIGWGFQLQNPIVVMLLSYLMFVIGLNLAGYFDIQGSFANFGGKLAQGDDLKGSFFTGVLATIVATPCTAPFMTTAISYALIQPAIIGLSVFAALGLGLALPYLVLSFVPACQKVLPKPGAWMDTFKQFLSFPMFAFAVWLLWILSQQTGSMGLFGGLLGFVLIAFGIWLVKVAPKKGAMRSVVIILAMLSFITSLGFAMVEQKPNVIQSSGQQLSGKDTQLSTPFSQEKLTKLLSGNDPVFVEMTAAWCITCKFNHQIAINIESTKSLFARENVQFLVGDWTNYDEKITKYLDEFGRNGVPIYVFYGARDLETGTRPKPKVLPQLLTPSIVADYVEGNI